MFCRFEAELEKGRVVAMKKYLMMASCVAVVYLINYLGYGFTFWYGSNLITQGAATVGDLFTVSNHSFTIVSVPDKLSRIWIHILVRIKSDHSGSRHSWGLVHSK